MCGTLDHTPSATRRAETPALARKSNQMFVEAAVALDPEKTVLQSTPGEVVLKFLGDESR